MVVVAVQSDNLAQSTAIPTRHPPSEKLLMSFPEFVLDAVSDNADVVSAPSVIIAFWTVVPKSWVPSGFDPLQVPFMDWSKPLLICEILCIIVSVICRHIQLQVYYSTVHEYTNISGLLPLVPDLPGPQSCLVGVSFSEPHHMGSTVESVFLLTCLIHYPLYG